MEYYQLVWICITVIVVSSFFFSWLKTREECKRRHDDKMAKFPPDDE